MRFPLLPVLVLLFFNGLIDFCIYRIIRNLYRYRTLARVQAVSAVLLAVWLLVVICMPKRSGDESSLLFVMWGLYAYLTVYIPKYVFLIVHLFAQVPKLWRGTTSKAVSMAGAVLAAVIFLLMWWGALINRCRIQVREVDVPVAELPSGFEGFRIAQISDLHVGTFGSDTAFISRLVQEVNDQHPDIILFTGDIVNRQSDEFEPFVQTLSGLQAPYGVYGVMGNHDYGDYRNWPTPQDKDADVANIKRLLGVAGVHMLNNDHVWLHAKGDSIALIGVENIGDPPFSVYGDLKRAYPDIADANTKVLMSHNPAHWEMEIENQPVNVALTLSGHTHAMQCELFGISPAALRYDKWGGLYSDDRGQCLYVNIGAGTVGMPYRIGATPEITVLTLRRKP